LPFGATPIRTAQSTKKKKTKKQQIVNTFLFLFLSFPPKDGKTALHDLVRRYASESMSDGTVKVDAMMPPVTPPISGE
jgi:hypothetical protein